MFSHGLEAQGRSKARNRRSIRSTVSLRHSTADWALLSRRGFSPTALESYARCPFQYFAGQVLELESVRQVPSMEAVPSRDGAAVP